MAQSVDVFFVLVGDVILSYPLANHWPATTAQRGGEPSRLAVLPAPVCPVEHLLLAPRLGQQQGLAAYEYVNSRKRQVLCDIGGRIWCLYFHVVNGQNSRAIRPVAVASRLGQPATQDAD